MIDRKILEFVESLNKEQKEELIKNLVGEKELTINELVEKAHENAVNKGFWEDYISIMLCQELMKKEGKTVKRKMDKKFEMALINEFLTLIASEVFEAQAELRKGNKEAFNEEIADIFIRSADLVGGLGIDIEEEIKKKMEYNKGREKMHGKLF